MASTIQTTASGRTYFTGTISGIDTQSLIANAVNARLTKKTRLTDQISANTAKIAAYKDIKDTAEKLNVTLNRLRSTTTGSDTNALNAKGITYLSSDSTTPTNVLTATATTDAQAGEYKVVVTQLAKAQSITSDSQTSRTDPLGYAGTFDIGEAGKTAATITVTATSTLEDIAAAINATTSTSGVKADILLSGNGQYKLVINAVDTAKEISVTNITGDDVLQGLGVTDALGDYVNESQPAQQAIFTINGTEIRSDTNKVTNVLGGLSLTLSNEAPTTTITITVGNNTEGLKEAIQNFIDAYNEMREAVTYYQKVDDTGTVSSSAYLYNDNITRTFQKQFSELVTDEYGSGSVYQSLAAIGVTINSDNKLELDSDTLDTALENNFSDVQSIFATSGAVNGFADTMYDMIDDYVADGTGTFDQEISTLEILDANLQTKADAVQAAADAYQELLINKYAKMEQQIQQSNILIRQISAILKGSTKADS